METDEQDFSAIDKHIAWEQHKKDQILNRRLSENWLSWAKVIGAVGLAIGLFLILLSVVVFIVKASGEPIKFMSFNNSGATTENVDLLLENVKNLEKSIAELKKEKNLSEQEVIEILNSQKSFTPIEDNTQNDNESITTSFTVFTTVDGVDTGKQYKPNNLSFPENQYCYFSEPIEGESTKSIRVDLAVKKGNEAVEYLNENDSSQRQLAESNCRFIDN